MTLILRIDDFPGTKPDEFWRHDLPAFQRFDALLEKHGVPEYHLGVIPRHVTQEQLEWLSTNPRANVALHGIDHDERHPNEFREWQTARDIGNAIASAKARLDPLVGPVDAYIPPHNVIDARTVEALRHCGFRTIFSGPGSDMEVLIGAVQGAHTGCAAGCRTEPMAVHHSHGHLYGRSDELLEHGHVDEIRHDAQSYNPHCLTLHWTWETNISLGHLNKFLTALGDVEWET